MTFRARSLSRLLELFLIATLLVGLLLNAAPPVGAGTASLSAADPLPAKNLALPETSPARSFPNLPVGADPAWWTTVQATIHQEAAPNGLPTTPDWVAAGENPDDTFGSAIVTDGDVNGDGYADVLVGALSYGSFRGKAYLFLGSPSDPALTPAWTMEGESVDDAFGWTVAMAGDVNGDGYDDILVAASQYDGPGVGRGKIYLYLGSAAGPSTTPDWTATGENLYDDFGRAMAAGTDVNGDGYSDLFVGACNYPGTVGRGKAYLYLGSPSGFATTPDWTATGENDGDYFAGTAAAVGDSNGDGYSDVIVAHRMGGPDYNGRAFLYNGSPTGLASSPSWTTTVQLPLP